MKKNKQKILEDKETKFLKLKIENSLNSIENKKSDFQVTSLKLIKKFDIQSIASYLDVKPNFIISLLKQKGYEVVSASSYLSEDQFKSMEDYFLARLNTISNVITKENIFNHATPQRCKFGRSGRGSGVYDEVMKYGLGKLIYIRRKG